MKPVIAIGCLFLLHLSASRAFAQASAQVLKSKDYQFSLRKTMAILKGTKAENVRPCKNMSGTPPEAPLTEFGKYYEAFGANFDVAASFGDAGAGGVPSAQNGIQPEALGQIDFESDHFFYNYAECLSRRPTLSFGGTVGIRPALVVENLTSTTATIANPKNRPMFQDAFGWTLGPRVNIATSQMSQADFFADLGENYLIDEVTSFKQGNDTITATPVSNDTGQSATFWETGLEWKYLGTDIATAYISKTAVLNPPFSISVGYKHDNRFKPAGDLAGISDAQSRLFFRFTVGLNKIANWGGNDVTPDKGYTFKFGVDYEKPIGNSIMPTATRYYVSANIDIIKVFKSGAK